MVGSSKEGQEQFEIHRSQGSDRLHALRLVLSKGVCRFHDTFRVGLVCKFVLALQAIRAVRDQGSRACERQLISILRSANVTSAVVTRN